MGDVAIVTITYESAEALADFLQSVGAASKQELPVVVVDNGSSDIVEVRRLAEAYAAELIELGENRGYGSAANEGARHLGTTFDFIIIANPDVTFSPLSVDRLLDGAARHPDAGSVGPRVLTAAGDVYPSARRLPSLREGIGHVLFVNVWPSNPWTRSYQEAESYSSERPAGWLSGSCLLIRSTAFREIGGFDDRYFMYFEDVDLGARLGEAGYANIYMPDAVVTHLGAHSTSKSAPRMRAAHHDSAYRYLAARYSRWYHWPVRFGLRAALAVRKAISSRR